MRLAWHANNAKSKTFVFKNAKRYCKVLKIRTICLCKWVFKIAREKRFFHFCSTFGRTQRTGLNLTSKTMLKRDAARAAKYFLSDR